MRVYMAEHRAASGSDPGAGGADGHGVLDEQSPASLSSSAPSVPVTVNEVFPPGPVVTVSEPGPVEQGVLDVVAALSGAPARPEMVAQARALARIMDDRRLSTTQPSANRQLLATMAELRRSSEPRRGRLARIEAMAGRTAISAVSQPSRGRPGENEAL